MNEKIKGAGFHHVALASHCFEETVEFYEKLGFRQIVLWGEGMGRIVMMDIGNGSILEIFANGSKSAEQNPNFFHLAIYAEDPDSAYELALASGATAKSGPADFVIESGESVKIRTAFVFGLNGEVIEFFKYR